LVERGTADAAAADATHNTAVSRNSSAAAQKVAKKPMPDYKCAACGVVGEHIARQCPVKEDRDRRKKQQERDQAEKNKAEKRKRKGESVRGADKGGALQLYVPRCHLVTQSLSLEHTRASPSAHTLSFRAGSLAD
jgi:hypothetical protein